MSKYDPRNLVLPALPFVLLLTTQCALSDGDSFREERVANTTAQRLVAVPANAPPSLKTVAVPRPTNLGDYVRDDAAAIRLGKALFWDMQVGSDGVTACASCHFHAGADNRTKNQQNPGSLRAESDGTHAPETTYMPYGPNHTLSSADFPFHKLADITDRNSAVLADTNDVVSSQGVFNSEFVAVVPGSSVDLTLYPPDEDGFRIGLVNTRRVEPRNAPTVINAVFNHRNFWDGRAQNEFNGVNIWGDRDPNAYVYRTTATGDLEKHRARLTNSSLASQALGPPISAFEMSADGRTFTVVGDKLVSSLSVGTGQKLLRDTAKKLLGTGLKPLGKQHVAADDSVLGSLATSGNGLQADYIQMIKAAFKSEFWNSGTIVQIDLNGERKLVRQLLGVNLDPLTLDANEYTQMQYNFSLFFGLAIQMYESTLVANDTPYDRMREGDTTALSDQALQGLALFSDTVRARCINCHGGAEMTLASVSKVSVNRLRRREENVIDFGYNNIGVRPTFEDIGLGDVDAISGAPLAEARLAAQGKLYDPTLSPPLSPSDIIGVDGAFKTPGLRNVELTGPYFHNGGQATLLQVVEFYGRGGDFQPIFGREGEISPLNTPSFTEEERLALVAFLLSLTDERVRFERAPFDHPEIFVPNGHPGDETTVSNRGDGCATDALLHVDAVGRNGRATPLGGFLSQ